MKITITVPNQELKKTAAVVALASGNELPENFSKVVDESQEVDITDVLKGDNEAKHLIQGLSLIALQLVIDKCDELESTDQK